MLDTRWAWHPVLSPPRHAVQRGRLVRGQHAAAPKLSAVRLFERLYECTVSVRTICAASARKTFGVTCVLPALTRVTRAMTCTMCPRCRAPGIASAVAMLSCACSRAFVRHLSGNDQLAVPSPTFLLHQTYSVTLVQPLHGATEEGSSPAASPSRASQSLAPQRVAQLGRSDSAPPARSPARPTSEMSTGGTASAAAAAAGAAAGAQQQEVQLHHFDLYRLPADDAALGRLELHRHCAEGVCLIEWAERLTARLPRTLTLSLSILSQV